MLFSVNSIFGRDCLMVFINLFLEGVRVGHSRSKWLTSSVAELQRVQMSDVTPCEKRCREDLVSLWVKQQRI